MYVYVQLEALIFTFFICCIQYLTTSAPQNLTELRLRNLNGNQDNQDGHGPQYQSAASTSTTYDEHTINLMEFPYYSTTFNLRNINLFRCILWPGTQCSLVLKPPPNHGLIVIVQKLNIRLNIRPKVGEVCSTTTTLHDSPVTPSSPSSSTYTIPCQCRDYLLVSGSNGFVTGSSKMCGRFDGKPSTTNQATTSASGTGSSYRRSSRREIVPYFVGDPKQYLFPTNDVVKLTLFHDSDNEYDDLSSDKWILDGDIGGIISVTSYLDCSKDLSLWWRQRYTNCSSSTQCISSSLFCDGTTNCIYDETTESNGQDELNCSTAQISPSPVPSQQFWQLLPVKQKPPSDVVQTTSRRSRPSSTSTTTPYQRLRTTPTTTRTPAGADSSAINDIRKTKTKSVPDSTSSTLSLAFILIVFGTVLFLTLCFGFLRIPKGQSTTYDTNEPLPNSARNRAFTRSSSSTSIDTIIDQIIAATSPPPEYLEASGLPSYDSLFQETAPISSNASASANGATQNYNTIVNNNVRDANDNSVS